MARKRVSRSLIKEMIEGGRVSLEVIEEQESSTEGFVLG